MKSCSNAMLPGGSGLCISMGIYPFTVGHLNCRTPAFVEIEGQASVRAKPYLDLMRGQRFLSRCASASGMVFSDEAHRETGIASGAAMSSLGVRAQDPPTTVAPPLMRSLARLKTSSSSSAKQPLSNNSPGKGLFAHACRQGRPGATQGK